MPLETRELCETLDQLDSDCADAEDRLAVASRYCDNRPMLHGVLQRMLATRREFRRALRERIRKLGGTPSDGKSLVRGARRILTATKSAIEENALLAQIDECRLGESFLLKSYERVLELDLPEEIRKELDSQLLILKTDLEKLRLLRKGSPEAEPGIDASDRA